MTKNIVLSGGTGFIGSHLVPALLARRYSVFVLTRQSIRSMNTRLHYIQVDIEKPQTFSKMKQKLPRKFLFIDAAAHIPSAQTAAYTHTDFIQHNFLDHVKLFETLQPMIERTVYLSTIDVYGMMQGDKLKETQEKNPLTAYGLSKSLLEDFYLFAGHQVPATLLRLSQVYGSGAHPMNAIPKFLEEIKKGNPIVLCGKGEELRTYIHIDDVVQSILLALSAQKTGVYNVAGGQTLPLRAVISIMQKVSPLPVRIQIKKRIKPRVDFRMDISKIKKELRFRPKVSLEQGIKDYFVC